MSAKGQIKDGVDEMILSALTHELQSTTIIKRKCGYAVGTTVENHLHRLSVKGNIVREKAPSPTTPSGYKFLWRLHDASQSQV
jgi:predicted transcriptional regulator